MGDRTTVYLFKNLSRIMTSGKIILAFLILHMKLYCVDKRLKTYMHSKCSLRFPE